jgi:hypothetical protein
MIIALASDGATQDSGVESPAREDAAHERLEMLE